jgi:hypothetical protein
MLNINQPDAGRVVTVAEANGVLTLSLGASAVAFSLLPRPGNYFESVYLDGESLGFVPGPLPVLAAALAADGGDYELTLYPLPDAPATETQGA